MTPRSDQSQLLQRLRVGATGLVLVVLLIVLASALFRSAIDEAPIGEDVATVEEQANLAVANLTPTGNPDEPLAELGISPGAAPGGNIATPEIR
ncbi:MULTISPECIES: hypothetical protein [unclassified Sphingomonas]|uniref:hypothetical protein n=1 Tax=unclassified Sphingomonas TaxID=196159 RepID=UPI000AF80BB5|nr:MULTISPECIES: hypothetical protein [unclassified Sphingomonas]